MEDTTTEEKKHISFSELKSWSKCPYYHKLTYIDGISDFSSSIFTCFGTAVHEVCEKSVEDKITNLNEQKILFKKSFIEELEKLEPESKVKIKASDIKDFLEQGENLVEHILPALKEKFGDDYQVFEAEEKIYEAIENLPFERNFKGFIDLIVKTSDGKYHIIDWKTCSWGWDARKKADKMVIYQLIFYKHFWSKKHNIPLKDIEVYFGLLKRTAKKNKSEIFKVTSGKKRIENALSLLDRGVKAIHDKKFVKNRLSCSSCNFYKTKHCP